MSKNNSDVLPESRSFPIKILCCKYEAMHDKNPHRSFAMQNSCEGNSFNTVN
jgi:hypothetical protein